MEAKPPSSLLAKPWRKLEKNAWTTEANEKLKCEIQTAKLTKEAGISHINVLLVGEISAGKSSFLNTVESVFTGHVTNRAGAGHGGGSLTTQYRQYKISSKGKEKNPLKFRFCDSMGLEGGENGLSASDIGKILDGHVQDTAELSGLLVPGKPGYIEHPTEEDRIHCLAFVLNANTVSLMDADLVKKMKAIRAEAKGRNLNPIVILTNADRFCSLTEDETRSVFHSKAVDDKVRDVSDVYGFTLGQIYPVCNYSSEIECDDDKDYLALVAMRQILRYSGDYLKDKVARLATEHKILKQKMAAMNKREKGRKHVENSDDGESDEEDEGEEDSDSDSDKSVEEEKLKSKRRGRNRNPPGDFPDSDYLPSRERNKKGLAPSVTSPTRAKGVSPGRKRLPPTPPKKTKQLQAIYNYEAQDEGDVYLFEGEVVDVVEEDVNGWTKVKKEDGAEGLVPTSYLGIQE